MCKHIFFWFSFVSVCMHILLYSQADKTPSTENNNRTIKPPTENNNTTKNNNARYLTSQYLNYVHVEHQYSCAINTN